MPAKRAFRDRDSTEVAVLDALVDDGGGMSVFELRADVEDADIDSLETALAALKQDDLITTQEGDGGVTIHAADRVVPDPEGDEEEPSLLDELRRRLPF